MILDQPEGPNAVAHSLNARTQEATLPPHLPRAAFKRLPCVPGIYFFKDAGGKIIYVGKAIDLRKRVLGHFYDSSQRERELCRETSSIDYETSGSELLAMLMEAVAIKQPFPKFNRAQKRMRPALGLFSYPDRRGILHLAINKIRKGQQALKVFYSATEARLYLEELCTLHGLCAKFCHLQEGVKYCGHFRVPNCGGVCRGTATVESYNSLVRAAISSLVSHRDDFLLVERGREEGEKALIWVSGGQFKGFGFVEASSDPSAGLTQIKPQPNYPETDSILQTYLLKHPDRVVTLEADVWQKATTGYRGQELALF